MKEIDLTSGSIFRKLIKFSLPMIVGNFLQQIYNLADTLIVGKYIGANALASVGSVYTLMTFITSIIIGLCMGSGAFFSLDYGAKNHNRLKEDIVLSFIFILSVSAIISIIIYPCMGLILSILQTPSTLMALTKEYVTVIFSGIIFIFLYNFFAYLLRSIGKPYIPLVFLGISSVLNIILDIWFVVSLNMGVFGAGFATVISQSISGIGLLIYSIIKLPIVRIWKDKVDLSFKRFREIIINDLATSVQQSVMNFGILMIQGLVNSFGEVIMASFAAAVKIDTLAYMPSQEFGNAYSLFISQNYGAKKSDRIKSGTKISFIVSAIFCLVISAIIFIFAESLMGIFVESFEKEIIIEGAKYLRIEGAMYVGIGILFLWYGYFRGINKPHISLILTIISLGTRVVLSYALAPTTPLGVIAIWISIPIGWVLADVVGCFYYRKNKL